MDSLRPNIDELRVESGTTIANYVVEELLGQGTEGSVYVARDSLLGRQVALKTLRIAEVGETRGVEEARLLASLEHPNVVRVLHARRHQGVWFVVFEYLAGGSLQGLLGRVGPLTPEQALDLLSQAAAGLAYVHEQNIVHRDLKPHNMLLSRSGELKICDFGLALDMRGPRRTQTLLVGTPAFLAPEVWAGASASTASDVFSLGVCLFQMLSGRLPFVGTTKDQLRQAHTELVPKFPAGLPPPVVELASAMLAKDPGLRPASRELPEMLRALAMAPYRARRPLPPSAQGRATLPSPFAPAGPEWAVREVIAQGRDLAVVAELSNALLEARNVELCSPVAADGVLLIDVVRQQEPALWPLLARVTLLKPQVTFCEVVERQLGLALKGSLAEACEQLADPARRTGVGSLLLIHAPRGITAQQRAEIEFAANLLALHRCRCVLTVPMPLDASDDGQSELAGFRRCLAFNAGEGPQENEARLALWLRLATDDRFHFSRDALRLAAHICDREGRSWAGLGLQSLLIASAAGTRVVASWAVLRARAHSGVWHEPSDVPSALRKPPLSWPSDSVAEQLHALRENQPVPGCGPGSLSPTGLRAAPDVLAV
jgi:eukaryotic-like serine/threonine-protein kinase